MTSSSSIVAFPSSKTNPWIEEYQQACLTRHDAGTIRVYRQILHQFTHWVGKRAGQVNQFAPSQITTPVVEQYLQELASQAYSPSHCKRVRSVIAQFCQWLIEDKALLQRNPTRGIVVDSSEPPAPFDPRILSPVQRLVLQNLVKQEDRRGKALFALGYWVGCRVTDIVDLQLDDTHIGAKSGWLHLGGEGAKARDIDLVNEASRVLHEPTECATRCHFQAKWLRAVFHRIHAFCTVTEFPHHHQQAVWLKPLVKPFHTTPPVCCNLVALVVGEGVTSAEVPHRFPELVFLS